MARGLVERLIRTCVVAVAWVAVGLWPSLQGADLPQEGDDATFRPTVMVRQGKSLGTGTIIASREGETLILTASHVVEDSSPVAIEFFRFNLGVERFQGISGFPRMVGASVVARDADADVAILKVRGQLAFPYVAKIARGVIPPPPGTAVTSIGFDKGARLIGIPTRVRSVDRVDLDKGGGDRHFVVTEDPPEVGRSGGGLYRSDGALVGVCVARVQLAGKKPNGLFSSLENVKDLIRGDEEIGAAMARSGSRPRSPAR